MYFELIMNDILFFFNRIIKFLNKDFYIDFDLF